MTGAIRAVILTVSDRCSRGDAVDTSGPTLESLAIKHLHAAFIGVIGSEPKSRTLRSTLLKEGFDESMVGRIHCPIGLPIGSNSPPEIAVSIAAQLLQERDVIRKSVV